MNLFTSACYFSFSFAMSKRFGFSMRWWWTVLSRCLDNVAACVMWQCASTSSRSQRKAVTSWRCTGRRYVVLARKTSWNWWNAAGYAAGRTSKSPGHSLRLLCSCQRFIFLYRHTWEKTRLLLDLGLIYCRFMSQTLGNWRDGRKSCRHSAPTSFLVCHCCMRQ